MIYKLYWQGYDKYRCIQKVLTPGIDSDEFIAHPQSQTGCLLGRHYLGVSSLSSSLEWDVLVKSLHRERT